MAKQKEFQLPPFRRGFHVITDIVLENLPELPEAGILHLYIKHTSAGLAINESHAPEVLTDFETVFNKLVPEDVSWYSHTEEGKDDMPAHIKSVLSGTSVQVPVTNGKLNMGTWQGIYLCEFRNNGGSRKLVATLTG